MAGEMRQLAATRIGRLIQAGDIEQLKTALTEGEDVQFKDRKGNTYLHYVATMYRPYIIHILVSEGIDINAQNKYGCTALHVTALQNECGHVADLMASGIDIFLKDRDGKIAAELKTESKYWHDIYRKYEPGMFQAIENHDVERVKELMHCWCRVDARRGTQTLRQFTAALKFHDLVWILDERKPTLRAVYGVLQCDHQEVEEAVKKSRCEINYLNHASTMQHVLQHALKLRDHRMVSLLCKAKADVNIPILISNYVKGPLFFEVINTSVPEDIMWTVLKSSADFSLKDERGRTALTYAMDKCNGKVSLEVMEYLLSSGTCIAARDETGATVRDVARFSRRKDVVKMIDKYLVKILRESNMKMLYQLAVDGYDGLLIEYNHRDTYIYACGNDTNEVLDFVMWLPTFQQTVLSLHQAVTEGKMDTVQSLLKEFDRPDLLVNAKDRGGRSPLHMAVLFQHHDILSLLLSTPGIDLDVRDNLYRTALHYAYLVGEGGVEMVKTLEAAGMDTTLVDTSWRKAEFYQNYKRSSEWLEAERKRNYSLAKELLCVDKYEELRRIITNKGTSMEDFYKSIRHFSIPIVTLGTILRPVMPDYRDLIFLAVDYGRVDFADRIACLGADLSLREKYEVRAPEEAKSTGRQVRWLTVRQRAEYLGFQELANVLKEKETYRARSRGLLQEQLPENSQTLEAELAEEQQEQKQNQEQEQELDVSSQPAGGPAFHSSVLPAWNQGQRHRPAKTSLEPLF